MEDFSMSKPIEIAPKNYEIGIVKKWYGIKTAAEIAEMLSVPQSRVYKICEYLGMKESNPTVTFSEHQEQIILGGILGDGNIKRNGSNYYYREDHGRTELEYCYWKMEQLEPYISKGGFHITDKRRNQMGFQTVNSPTFSEYKHMETIEVINALDETGAVVYLLDDGWARDTGFCLSTGSFDRETENALVAKLNEIFDTNATVISHQTISFHKSDMPNLLAAMNRVIPHDIDIYKKKIKRLTEKFKV